MYRYPQAHWNSWSETMVQNNYGDNSLNHFQPYSYYIPRLKSPSLEGGGSSDSLWSSCPSQTEKNTYRTSSLWPPGLVPARGHRVYISDLFWILIPKWKVIAYHCWAILLCLLYGIILRPLQALLVAAMQLQQRASDKQTDNIVAECLRGLKAKYRHGGTVQSAAYSEGVLCM